MPSSLRPLFAANNFFNCFIIRIVFKLPNILNKRRIMQCIFFGDNRNGAQSIFLMVTFRPAGHNKYLSLEYILKYTMEINKEWF